MKWTIHTEEPRLVFIFEYSRPAGWTVTALNAHGRVVEPTTHPFPTLDAMVEGKCAELEAAHNPQAAAALREAARQVREWPPVPPRKRKVRELEEPAARETRRLRVVGLARQLFAECERFIPGNGLLRCLDTAEAFALGQASANDLDLAHRQTWRSMLPTSSGDWTPWQARASLEWNVAMVVGAACSPRLTDDKDIAKWASDARAHLTALTGRSREG